MRLQVAEIVQGTVDYLLRACQNTFICFIRFISPSTPHQEA